MKYFNLVLLVFVISCTNSKEELLNKFENDFLICIDVSRLDRYGIKKLILELKKYNPKSISALCEFTCIKEDTAYMSWLISNKVISAIGIRDTFLFWKRHKSIQCGYLNRFPYQFGYTNTFQNNNNIGKLKLKNEEAVFYNFALLVAFSYDSIKTNDYISEHGYTVDYSSFNINEYIYIHDDELNLLSDINLDNKLVLLGDFESEDKSIIKLNLGCINAIKSIIWIKTSKDKCKQVKDKD